MSEQKNAQKDSLLEELKEGLQMTNDAFTDIAIKITSELSALNANMKNVLDKLADHEQRLGELERDHKTGWKDQLLMLLAKALVVGGVSIAALAGAGGILEKIIR